MLSDRSCWRQCAAVAVLASTLLSRSVVNSSETVQPNEDAKRLLGEHFDGAKIIAIRNNAVVTIDLDSGSVRTLASFKQAKRFQGLNRPWWSRDGKEVIVSYAGQAHRMDADGANLRKILEGERDYAGTHACRRARAIGKEYGLPKRAIAPANERLVVTASIEAVSKVPTAQQIAPYRDAVTYIVYKAGTVIDGKYEDERIVVVHWGMKNAKHTAAASWKPGRKQKLTLDLFDAHKELQGITAAQDADEPELIPYWALKVEGHR